ALGRRPPLVFPPPNGRVPGRRRRGTQRGPCPLGRIGSVQGAVAPLSAARARQLTPQAPNAMRTRIATTLALAAALAVPAGALAVRAVPDGDGATASQAPPTATVTVFRGARATWYGPGFYGHRLACGGRLTSTTLGVAHRTLPCGTPVQVYFRGRSLTVPVVDRGPFANGASYDLTAATARALGFKQTSRIGVMPQP